MKLRTGTRRRLPAHTARGSKARAAGLATVTSKHTLPPDPTVLQHLLETHRDHEVTLISFACQRTLNDHKRAIELIRGFARSPPITFSGGICRCCPSCTFVVDVVV